MMRWQITWLDSDDEEQWFTVDDYELAHTIADEMTADKREVRVIDCSSGAVVYGEQTCNGVASREKT